MTDNSKIEAVARGLTEAQRLALAGTFAWESPHEQDEGEAELYRLGLWNPKPKYGEKAITPLGIAVRNHIKGPKP